MICERCGLLVPAEEIRILGVGRLAHCEESDCIVALRDERERILAAATKAVRGIRGELADQTQGAAETLSKIDARVDELAGELSVPCPA